MAFFSLFLFCLITSRFFLPLFGCIFIVKIFMYNRSLGLWWVGYLFVFLFLSSCGKEVGGDMALLADSLNHQAYDVRYKNLDYSEKIAQEALRLGENIPSIKAEALNNLAFCAFIRMDFEKAGELLKEVYKETTNELECLVADVGMMKICQRTAMNKEFYDYRNSALRRMKRISEDESAMNDTNILRRFNYAKSEFSITSAIYYYYLQQEKQSLMSIDEVEVDNGLEDDTAQLLYFYYMKGSGGMYEAETSEDVVVGEFDYLVDCLMLSHEQGYVYFEANASQAMAELLKDKKNYDLLLVRRPGMMRIVNHQDLPWEELPLAFADNALKLFEQYGDWYQISVAYRTMAACCNELGRHNDALSYLTKALSYVNLHHEKFYHCHDMLDRLKPYVPMATESTELKWINTEGIMTVPEWIARFREQLSVTYAALGMKPQSDYNRNIYLDILDYTRQDKELESRYMSLEAESNKLNMLLALVGVGFLLVIVLMVLLNKRWRIRNTLYIEKLRKTLDICRGITASVPVDAREMEDVVAAIMQAVKGNILSLVNASDMDVILSGEECLETTVGKDVLSFLLKDSNGETLAIWKINMPSDWKKEDKALLEVIVPYLAWTLENGLMIISLGDERRRLEKEQYVHELHLVENKRQNVIKKACLSLVTGIVPYIDRVVNEVHKLIAYNYLADKDIKINKYRYIDELITRINEYNEILALWIKMRQGALSLNIENFELAPLFEVLQKGQRNFEMKKQTLKVEATSAVVKADKALTLFMINTLMENARKYTQVGGNIQVYACEEEDYVEISVQDNGIGMSSEDVKCILDEKVYDSAKIGLETVQDVEELKKNKGSGFGLMNCRGIIEKYKKVNELFRVCCFQVESRVGEGSRFYFRLPKGVKRVVNGCAIFCMMMLGSCAGQEVDNSTQTFYEVAAEEEVKNDSLLSVANRFAERVYQSNLEGKYSDALVFADSALTCLNTHYMKYASQVAPMLQLIGKGAAAELEWFDNHFDTDYYILLDVRNEAAVAYLALGELDAYRYNNQAYTSLYKQLSVDVSLEEYCTRMQMSTNNKMVAILLCVALLVALVIGYYLLYLRHRLMYQYSLEQVIEINRKTLTLPAVDQKEVVEVASQLAVGLYQEMNELLSIENLGVAVYNEDHHSLSFAFSSVDEQEAMRERMEVCFNTNKTSWNAEEKLWCLPLCVEAGSERRCLGVMALRCVSSHVREDDRLTLELIGSYIAIMVFHAVVLVAQKFREIEAAQDEARRIVREENLLHVQNLVLDNCLSTIKHETIYYPNRIKQIIGRLNEHMDTEEELRQVKDMSGLIDYYKEIFTILSSCAARQLEDVTFRRGVVKTEDLTEAVSRYFKRVRKKVKLDVELILNVETVAFSGDVVLLKFLLENLVNEALTYSEQGILELHIYREDAFVRFDFIDRRRCPSQEYLNQLFYPHLSRIQHQSEELTGTEYLICKQIIRDHDEFAGRRGCRMNACQAPDGGFMVWFTLPAK